jgi:ribosome-associated toxin RatA of RatAB toxin-antitoxin module
MASTLAVALILIPALSAAASDLALAESDRQRLERGDVLFTPLDPADGRGVAARAMGVVEAPPGSVWPALRDCEHYQEFLPGVRTSALRSRENDVAVCYTEIELPWPLPDLVSKTRVEESRIAGGGYVREWRLIDGSYRRNVGSWRLHPWGADGGRTLAVYRVDFDPQTVLPDWLLRRAQRSTVPGVFEALRQRVSALAADGAP